MGRRRRSPEKTVAANTSTAEVTNRKVIRPASDPYSASGGTDHPLRQPRPAGAVVKSAAVAKGDAVAPRPGSGLRFRGSATKAIMAQAIQAGRRGGDTLRRPKGWTGHERNAHPDLASSAAWAWTRKSPSITDGRFSGRHARAAVGHVSSRGCQRRAHRRGAGRRHDQHRHPKHELNVELTEGK